MTIPSTEPSYRTIPLSQGQEAIVDASNYEWLNVRKWYAMWDPAKRGFYAVRHGITPQGKDRLVYMHREVLGLKYGDVQEGDHRNREETLDNRIQNLRIVNDQQQQFHKGKYTSNQSGFKGVSKCSDRDAYLACISIDGKTKNLGRRKTPEAAYELYCSAARRLHGEYVCLD
jgi:hypothetical protein